MFINKKMMRVNRKLTVGVADASSYVRYTEKEGGISRDMKLKRKLFLKKEKGKKRVKIDKMGSF